MLVTVILTKVIRSTRRIGRQGLGRTVERVVLLVNTKVVAATERKVAKVMETGISILWTAVRIRR